MSSVKISPVFNDQTFDANGNLANGYKLFVYAAGSSTKQTSYTDSTGGTAQSNPIIINSLGYPTNGTIWLTAGLNYKFILTIPTDTDPPTSPIKTIDNVSGVNDASISISQWVASSVIPTYISTTSFSLVGDQTTEFHVGRRAQFSTTGGTVYGTILTTAYTTLTTVTMTMDAGQVLDAGLSAVNLSILRNDYLASPAGIAKSGANSDITSLSGLTTPLSIAQGGMGIQPVTASVAASALTVTLNPTALDFRSATLGSGTVNTRSVSPAISLVVPSTATLGTVNATLSRLILLAIDNAGTVELAVINAASGTVFDEASLVSTTAISAAATASNVIYSTTARTNVPFRVVGYVESTQATAGTWATAPSLIQGIGGNTYKSINAIQQSMVRLSTNGAGALGYGSTYLGIRRFTTVVTNQGPDITYADSATNGALFTINTAGVYAISHSDSYASATQFSGISLNSANLSGSVQLIPASEVLAITSGNNANANMNSSWTGYLAAGSLIRPHGTASGGTGTVSAQFTIARVA